MKDVIYHDFWNHKIYTLSDPITNMIRYVGRTRNSLKERLLTHQFRSSNKEKDKWLAELKKKGLFPVIELVEDNVEFYIITETYWISQFNTWGFDLFNKKIGTQKYRNI